MISSVGSMFLAVVMVSTPSLALAQPTSPPPGIVTPSQSRVLAWRIAPEVAMHIPHSLIEAVYEQRNAPLEVITWQATDVKHTNDPVATHIKLGSLFLEGLFIIRHHGPDDRWNSEVLAIGELYGCTEFDGDRILWAWTSKDRTI
tara:strand:- start:3017 stop:3451 length:435 start_codon:yes stop_codon:yes gene_type:complete